MKTTTRKVPAINTALLHILNLSITTLKNFGFLERAKNLGILELLKNACILPHGGGYSFTDIEDVLDVLAYKHQRYFVTSLKTNISRLKIIKNVGELQFEYRGRDIILKTIQLDLGDIIARLTLWVWRGQGCTGPIRRDAGTYLPCEQCVCTDPPGNL